MASTLFRVASQFSRFPGGRYRSHGPKSGEEFRDDVLLPLLQQFDEITIDLTGAAGYGASFLDESFGELGKTFGAETLRPRLKIIADDDPHLIPMVWQTIEKGAADRDSR